MNIGEDREARLLVAAVMHRTFVSYSFPKNLSRVAIQADDFEGVLQIGADCIRMYEVCPVQEPMRDTGCSSRNRFTVECRG